MIYLASSWRNEHQLETLDLIRRARYEVYDFRNPTDGVGGFSWQQLGTVVAPCMWSAAELAQALRHPEAVRGHGLDQAAMDHATACVLLLPCGSSAHLAAGYCAGRGVPTVVYAPSTIEPELMYLTFGSSPIVTTPDELLTWLARTFTPAVEWRGAHLEFHRRQAEFHRRQARLARARIAEIAGSHHSQRVTAADLAAVRAQELADIAPAVTISDPIEVRELPPP